MGREYESLYKNGPVHITKLAVMPIYGKNILCKQTSDHFDTWHQALITDDLSATNGIHE